MGFSHRELDAASGMQSCKGNLVDVIIHLQMQQDFHQHSPGFQKCGVPVLQAFQGFQKHVVLVLQVHKCPGKPGRKEEPKD